VRACIAEHYEVAAQLRQISDPSRWNLVVTAGGTWAGHAQLKSGGDIVQSLGDPPAIELARFYVDTAFHGRGVAQAMMRETKAEAKRRGARRIGLSVWQEQPQAMRFYEKEGFRIAGELIFMVGDDPKDDWLMVCDLD
jgi:ribosomal protein S18 acetylase RimI-like enzyme